MSVLDIVQATTSRLGVPVPATVFGNNSQDVIQLRELLKQAGRSMADDFNWVALRKERTITTVAAEVQPNAKPADFAWLDNATFFNRTRAWEMIGPITSRDYQSAKASNAVVTSNQYYLFRGADLMIWPAPEAGETLVFEYLSTNWARDSLGAEKATFTADTDTAVFSEDTLGLSLEWRYLKAKGLDYAEAFREFEGNLTRERGRDGGAPRLVLQGGYGGRFRGGLGYPMLPEGSWFV